MDKAAKVGVQLASVRDLSVQGTAKVFLCQASSMRVAGAGITAAAHRVLAVALPWVGWQSRAGLLHSAGLWFSFVSGPAAIHPRPL